MDRMLKKATRRNKRRGQRNHGAWQRFSPVVLAGTASTTGRRVTRHRIPDSIGKDSEEVLGPTDPPRSESLGGKQHVGKAATV